MTDLTLTFERERPLDPPEVYTRIQQQDAVHPMTYGDGHLGWLVTGYTVARAVLADPRFSSRTELAHPPIPSRLELAQRVGADELKLPPGFFLRMDAPEHTRFRKLLTGQFTVRRMKQLEPRIQEITESCLDDMEATGPPADLVSAFAMPIPSLVICELLGVPYEDRAQFQEDSKVLLSLEGTGQDALDAITRISVFLHELVDRKRAHPEDDLISGLVASGELSDAEITGAAVLMLIAGHETTANMLALGTYALLTNPGQLAAMRDDPALLANGVEELLRYLSILHLGPVRTALEDLELDGRLIKKGDSVTLHLPVINRDPSRFPGADRLDVTREVRGHLAFGHGIHQCLGQQLARIEMRIAYGALLRRLPGLGLAVPPEEVPMRSDMSIYGVHRLPVTW
ncbi:cytochrome P450 [Nonomuraea sp. ZG12]|uniref:cytochrome P450 n=1 Tax=Nonomuraea sp. ZG12 TaxID=3452207 RepID=UPI003F8B678F